MKRLRLRTVRKRWIFAVVAIVLVIALIGGVMGFRNYYNNSLEPVSNSQTAVTITIEEGSTLSQIATTLHDNGLIRNERVFSQYVRSKNVQDQLQAGTYSLRPSQSVAEITTILTHGNIVQNLFTLLPGQRLDQVKSAMINAGFDATEVEAAFNPDLYKNHPALVDKPVGASLEGYLYPESFQKTAETEPSTVIRQSLDEMAANLTPELRNAFVKQGLTVYQGVILASVIEQEVSNPADRPIVAQVFLKRLRQGMNLQSDATAPYGAVLAGQKPSLTYDSPYNTYKYAGLPPTPISNVSATSLKAVANPAATDWLYFVSGDDGTTHFSSTNEEHEKLTEQYCKRLCN